MELLSVGETAFVEYNGSVLSVIVLHAKYLLNPGKASLPSPLYSILQDWCPSLRIISVPQKEFFWWGIWATSCSAQGFLFFFLMF